MSEESDESIVKGDGELTIPAPDRSETEKEDDMSTPTAQVDLSVNVANLVLTESVGNIQASNRNSRGIFDAVAGAIGATIQTNLAEVGVLEGRAVSGVMATPIAAPSTGG